MHYLAKILSIKPCGCDAEGEVQAQIDDGPVLWFYYQGSDAQVAERFSVGAVTSIELVGKVSTVSIAAGEEKSISFEEANATYRAVGQITGTEEVDGETLYLLDASFPMRIDVEQGREMLAPGVWVKVMGEIWAENWWP